MAKFKLPKIPGMPEPPPPPPPPLSPPAPSPVTTVEGVKILCAMGTQMATLHATNAPTITAGKKPVATMMDNVLGVNIDPPKEPFKKCWAPSNPETIKATAKNGGIPEPGKCLAAFPGPWIGSQIVRVRGMSLVNGTSQLMCVFGGAVVMAAPGQTAVINK